MIKPYIPFTYLIGWSRFEKYYYGVKYGKGTHPDMLWVTYFTSSKFVKKFAFENGPPDIIQIRKTFETKEQAVKWEYIVIRRLNAVKSKKWFNQNNGGTTWGLMERTEEHRKNLSIALTGKKRPKEVCDKIAAANRLKVRKPLTDEQRQRMSEARKGIVISDEGRANLSKALKGKPKSKEHNKKVSEALMGHVISDETKRKIGDKNRGKVVSEETKERMRNQQRYECPHCHGFYKSAMLSRWHGDNCKLHPFKFT